MKHTIPGLGHRVRIVLAAQELTRQGLADKLGVARDVVTRMVTKDHSPNARTIRTLAEVTGMSADWLMGLPAGKRFD